MQVDGCWEKWGGCGRGGTNKAARFSQIKLWVRGCDATLSLAVTVMHPYHPQLTQPLLLPSQIQRADNFRVTFLCPRQFCANLSSQI